MTLESVQGKLFVLIGYTSMIIFISDVITNRKGGKCLKKLRQTYLFNRITSDTGHLHVLEKKSPDFVLPKVKTE